MTGVFEVQKLAGTWSVDSIHYDCKEAYEQLMLNRKLFPEYRWRVHAVKGTVLFEAK